MIDEMISDTTTNAGVPFGDEYITALRLGNVSITIISEVPGRPGWWFVQRSSPGIRLGAGKLPVIEMSEEKIIQGYEEQLGQRAMAGMSTIGTRPGERTKRRSPLPRRWHVPHLGESRAFAVHC